MADLIANSTTYNIITNNELAEVLSHYNSEFVLSVVEDAINRKQTEIPLTPMPNIIEGWEMNFKAIQDMYTDFPDTKTEVPRVRSETYIEVIDMICKKFDLTFTTDQNVDLYSAAYIMYDFFVCNFIGYMIKFFSKYIYKEHNSIYELLNLSDQKKNKDSSTVYGKKIYKDIKLAIINANITAVLTEISSLDIELSDIINMVLTPYNAVHLNNIVSSNTDFFKIYYISLLQNISVSPILMSEIMFKLHNLSIVSDSDMIPNLND